VRGGEAAAYKLVKNINGFTEHLEVPLSTGEKGACTVFPEFSRIVSLRKSFTRAVICYFRKLNDCDARRCR